LPQSGKLIGAMLERWTSLLVAASLACVLSACGGGSTTTGCPAAGATGASEACVRAELGIPKQAERVLILSQSSHLDWDWLRTFEDYYTLQVESVFTDALSLMAQSHSAAAHYYYSVAEMGYLQRFAAQDPQRIDALRAIGTDLRIVGGGITSPDNLIPHGESFIRDYLVGKTWVDANLGLPLRAAWIPDDFGHDAQLPISLAAMGIDAVGFARVPGVDTALSFGGIVPPRPGSLAEELLGSSLDFVWEAADGSRVLAHWMPQSYCQGDTIDQPPVGQPSAGEMADALQHMHGYLDVNGPASPTPYVFAPIGCDFAHPKAHLLDYVNAWNASEYAGTGVWAVAASFDHYAQLIASHRDALPILRFDPTPYWTGFYASRPVLKALHYAATRALLAAEVFGALADGITRADALAWSAQVAARTQALHQIWAELVPSNHHDYVTGTAPDTTYQGEQVPRLTDALAHAEVQRDQTLDDLAAAIAAPGRDGEQAVAVFNALGFERSGLVELADASVDSASVVRTDAADGGRVQPAADGGLLFSAAAPSFGYASVHLHPGTPAPPAADESVSVTGAPDGGSIVLENAALRAEITLASGWGVDSLVDKATGAELIAPGAPANVFVIYDDQGGLYRFGNEMNGCTLVPHADDTRQGMPAEILEAGPLRVRVRAPLLLAGQPFETIYTLEAGEPFLRMHATGAAPSMTSVMVHIPLAEPLDGLLYGTAYHWDRKGLERAPWGVSFEATHDFVVPELADAPRAAIYHSASPAWAARDDGLVIGVLWRNAHVERCDFYGGVGSDPDSHEVDYALRVPTGIEAPETGQTLREALSFNTPLFARVIGGDGLLPPTQSLASADPPAALLTAAKSATASPQALVLRVYQPTNAPLPVEITTAARARVPPGTALTVRPVTALEDPLPPAQSAALNLHGDADHFQFLADHALTSVSIAR
jgi:alpha-mannosidase